MSKQELLYEKIQNDLMQDIQNDILAPGDKIPGVAELRQRYSVSHITVLRAYKELVQRKAICKHGHGYIVSSVSDLSPTVFRRDLIAGFFLRPVREHSHDDYFNEINIAAENSCRTANFDILRSFSAGIFNGIVTNYREDELLINLRMLSKHCAGLLIDERLPETVLAKFAEESSLPMVVVNRCSLLPVSSVYPDNDGAMRELFANLLRLGYRKVIYLHFGNEYYSRNESDRLAKVREFISDNTFETLKIMTHNVESGDLGTHLDEFEMIIRNNSEKVALVAANDYSARCYGNGLLQRNLIPGRDFGLAGFYNSEISLSNGAKLCSVAVDTRSMGMTAANILIGLIRKPLNGEITKQAVRTQFVFGETV